MLNKNKSFKFMLYILAVLAVVLMLIFPDICKNGINKGVLICSNVIIHTAPISTKILSEIKSESLADLDL